MLRNQMMEEMKVAMRENDAQKKIVLSLIRADLISAEKEKGAELTQEEEITIVSRQLKQTNDSLEAFEKAGRQDLVDKELEKIAIIEQYLPKQMNKAELVELIESLNIDKSENVGKTIGRVMGMVKGKADGKLVQETVKEYMNT